MADLRHDLAHEIKRTPGGRDSSDIRLLLAAVFFDRYFSGRTVYLQIGAMMGSARISRSSPDLHGVFNSMQVPADDTKIISDAA